MGAVSGHRAVIEAGPATIRRLCCGAAESAHAVAALDWIDDPVGLVDGQPVAVSELLCEVLDCAEPVESVEVIHPSWWPDRRVQLLIAAAPSDEVATRPRSRLLFDTFGADVVVEIAARLVAVIGPGTDSGIGEITAEARIGSPDEVADAVSSRVSAAVRDRRAVVVIDAPAGVACAAVLAMMIDQRLRPAVRVIVVEALPAGRVVEPAATSQPAPGPTRPASRRRLPLALPLAIATALSVVVLGLRAHHDPPPEPTTYLIEGRVAVQVPADWPARRITGGPGSARVELVSPTDPQLVLHITQAPALGDTLAAVAEPLERAKQLADAETPGVFVDFEPAGTRAGRPAVTYREVRGDHQIDWAVLVDRAVRIGIGCQSRPGGEEALRAVCEQAVRSAHAVTGMVSSTDSGGLPPLTG